MGLCGGIIRVLMGHSFQIWSHQRDSIGGFDSIGVREVGHHVRWATKQRLFLALCSGGRTLLNVL